MGDIRTEVSDIRTEVSDVRTEVSDVRTELSDLGTDVSDVGADACQVGTGIGFESSGTGALTHRVVESPADPSAFTTPHPTVGSRIGDSVPAGGCGGSGALPPPCYWPSILPSGAERAKRDEAERGTCDSVADKRGRSVASKNKQAVLATFCMSTATVRNVLIIGSGPAGHTAGIYAARANLKPLMIEGLARGGIPGGQLMITNDVENYPGFPEKIAGPELMKQFRDQSVVQGVEIITDDVVKVDLSKRPFTVWVGDGKQEYQSKTLIIATGAQAKWLGLPSEAALQGKGVSACAVCDGAFFRNQDVIVVGGGDTAMEEATYLSGLCKTVTLVHRREAFRASKTMQERVLKNAKIKPVYNAVVDEVLDVSRGEVTGARLKNVKTGESMVVHATGLFVAIGHTPNTDLFAGQLELHDNGYIKTRPGSAYTSVPGVFACGDVQDFTYRQAVTAAGSGCMAALDAERWMGANDPH